MRRARVRVGPPNNERGTTPVVADIRRVVVILASSRSGSSLLFDLLRRTGSFVCLDGEHTHLYKLNSMGLPGWPDAHDGDVDPDADGETFLADLLSDCTVHSGQRPRPTLAYSSQVARRLVAQWPVLTSRVEEVRDVAEEQLLRRTSLDGKFDQDQFLLKVIDELRQRSADIDPRYYDIPCDVVRKHFPALATVATAPPLPDGVIEEPPFVVPQPAAPATPEDLISRPLLIKASVDAYRVALLEKLLSGADVRFIHLTRNPAAAVNGLYDGWRDRGFFSHHLSGRATLAIDGYSETLWGSEWWNFDLPPAWRDVVRRPLQEVCAFQWCQANSSILAALATSPARRLSMQAEEVMAGLHRRAVALRRIFEFCGIDPTDGADSVDRVLMSTKRPTPGRWRERAAVLGPVLGDPRLRDLASRLGYGPEPDSRWT
ncbi:hypothetical protein [Micromonospora sp. LOL_021]|uniref:hypothetical protein n=1 Tax=Micromonospora sp. LOL_021 TaxID=3345417 RepID=UPI003A841831